jgi:putative phosphoribosyl transferase
MSDARGVENPVSVGVPVSGEVSLVGDLRRRSGDRAMVLFAHGSGSGRHSPRNRGVADALGRSGIATLLIDLLTPDEEQVDAATAQLRFDIPLLGRRLTAAADWLHGNADTAQLPIFLFGASTGAAAALVTAAQRPQLIAGVISRGGRPDLAHDVLADVTAPTVLIVGGNDPAVLNVNRSAAESMRSSGGHVDVRVVPGATHLFEEPGALDQVMTLTLEAIESWLAARPDDVPAPDSPRRS